MSRFNCQQGVSKHPTSSCRFVFAEAWVEKPSFGKSLEEHLNISGREIAFPIEACVTMLLECGMQEEVEGTHTHIDTVFPCNLKQTQISA